MKIFTKAFCILLVAVMAGLIVIACSSNEEQCPYGFANNTVSVALTNKASIQLLEKEPMFVFTKDFFPGLKLKEVEHANFASSENVRKQLKGETVNNPINRETFMITLWLHLAEPNHQTVLQYVELIEVRDDVYWVSPSYFGSVPTSPKQGLSTWENAALAVGIFLGGIAIILAVIFICRRIKNGGNLEKN